MRRPSSVVRPASRERWTLALYGLLLAVAVLDVLYFRLVTAPESLLGVPMADSAVYLQLASEIRSGGTAAHSIFYWSPLYTLLLALLTGAGSGPVIALQMLAGLGTLFLVFQLGRRVGSSRAGFLAALCLALYFPFLMQQGKLVPVTFASLLALAGVWFFADGHGPGTRTWTRTLLAGLCFGLAGLLMPQLLLVPVLVAIGSLVQRARQGLVPAALLLAGALLAVVPVCARNVIVGQDFIPVSSSAGFNLFLGFNPSASGLIGRPREMLEFTVEGRNLVAVKEQDEFQRRFAEQELGRPLKPSETSSFWTRRSLDFMRAQPGKVLKLLVSKLRYSLLSYEFANSYYPEIERALAWPLRVTFLPWAVLLGLALAGLVLTWRQRSTWWPLMTVPVAVLVSLLLFFVNSRYRLPAAPALVVLAGLGIDVALRAGRRTLMAGAGITAVVAVISAGVLRIGSEEQVRYDEAYGWRNLSLNAQKLGRYDEALDLLDRSARLIVQTPRDARSAVQYDDLAQMYVGLGNQLLDRRNSTAARRAYEQAVQLNPGSGTAWLMRGVTELGANQLSPALNSAEQALRLDPTLTNAYALKARALLGLGRRDEAIAVVREATLRDPGSLMIQALMAALGLTP